MSSSNNSSSSSSGSGSSFIPNYREEDFLNNLAKAAQDLMTAQREWGLQQYGKNSQITDQVVNDALATNQFMSGSARKDLERYQKLFQPLENQLLSQASSYASPARMRAEIGAGKAGAAQSMAAQRRNAEKALAGYGINPSSGRYAALDKASRIQQGAAEAAAGQAARRATEATARSLRSEGLQIGGQYPTRIGSQVNQALQASTTGINSALANTQVGINALGSPQTWAQIANALKYPPLGNQHSSSSSSGSRGSGGQQQPHAIPAQHPDDKKGGSGSGKGSDKDSSTATDSREADRAEREAEKAADRESREAIAAGKGGGGKGGGAGGKSPGKQSKGGQDQEGKEEERAHKSLMDALAAQNAAGKGGGPGGAGITNIPPKRGDGEKIGAGAKEGGRGSMGEALKDWERGEKNQEDEVDKWLRESGVDPLTGEPIERDQQNMPLEGDMRELPGEERFKYGDDTPPGPKGDEEMTNPPVEQDPWGQTTGENTNADPNAPENVGWGQPIEGERDPYDPFTGSGGATDEPTFPPELTGQELQSDIGAGDTEEGADPFGRYGYQNDPYAENDDEQSINDLGPYYNPGDEFESWGAEGDGTIYGMEEGDVLDSWGAEGESPYDEFGQDGGSAYDYAQAGDWGYGDESAYDGFDPNSGDGFDYASAGDWGYGDESPYDGYDAGSDNFDYDNEYADNDFGYDAGYDNFDYDNEYADNDFGYDDSGYDDSGYDASYDDYDYGNDDWGSDDSGYDDYDYGNDDYGSDDYGGYDDYDSYDDYDDDDYGGYDDYSDDDYGGYDDYDDYARGGQVRGRTPALALGGPTTGGAVSRNASPSRGRQVDDVPARLNAGEFVIPRDVAHFKGREFFENLIKKSRTARGAPQQPTGATMAPAGPTQRPRFRSRPMGR